jgi:hypothetical protein
MAKNKRPFDRDALRRVREYDWIKGGPEPCPWGCKAGFVRCIDGLYLVGPRAVMLYQCRCCRGKWTEHWSPGTPGQMPQRLTSIYPDHPRWVLSFLRAASSPCN